MQKSRYYSLLSLVILTCLSGCAHQAYVAKPLNPEQSVSKILLKSPYRSDFKNYLLIHGYPEDRIPFKNWGIQELTLSALFYHPDIAVAQQRLAASEANTAILQLSPSMGINTHLSHSNQANGDIRPWSYGLQLEIPIDTSHKRDIRVEEAKHLTEVVNMDLAETAWQLRQQISLDLITYHENLSNVTQLQKILSAHQSITQLYQKRLEKGLASSVDVSQSRLYEQKYQTDLLNAQAKTPVLLSKLAGDAGLTLPSFSPIPVAALDIESTLTHQNQVLSNPNAQIQLQQNALLNRIDIRRSLAKYAAAESRVKLEIAKQTPDISLSPGIAFDFGDSIWSLGFASLLNLANQSSTQIHAAEQLRATEGAQFEALQANVIGSLSTAYTQYQVLISKLAQAKQLHEAQLQHMEKIQKQFNAGLLDRMEITQAQLNIMTSEQSISAIQFELLRAQADIENIMQCPLFDSKDSFRIETTRP
jgi:outer membrane protein, heavy metal efflux system